MRLTILFLLIGLAETRGEIPLQPALRDYIHTAWTQHDGLPIPAIENIVQTPDGYLWILTKEGLLRFDGVRFVAEPIPCPRVDRVLNDGAGGLWLMCGAQFFRRSPSGSIGAGPRQSLPVQYQREDAGAFVDHAGRLWSWGRSLAFFLPGGAPGPDIPDTDRPAGAVASQFAEDSEGNVWFAVHEGLLRIRDGRAVTVLKGYFWALAPAASGGIYALAKDSLLHVSASSISTVARLDAGIVPSSGAVLTGTSEGIWFGTAGKGVGLLRRGRFEFFGRQQGLSSDSVTTVMADREGSVWVGTPLGLHRFRKPLAYLMSEADGRPSGLPVFVLHDSRNALWIGTSVRTVRIDGTTGKKSFLEGRYDSIGEDGSGRIWLGGADSLGYFDGEGVRPVRDTAGRAISQVHSFQRGEKGSLWALARQNGLYRIDGIVPELQTPLQSTSHFLVSGKYGVLGYRRPVGIFRMVNGVEVPFGPITSSPVATVHTFYEDGDSLWIGAADGLYRYRNGKWTVWTAGNGLPGEGGVFEIVSDSQKRLWLMSAGGILVLNRGQFDRTPDGKPGRLDYLRIGSFDRVLPHIGGIATSPRVTIDRDGKVFFATFDSVAVVDPAELNEQSFVPPIVLETVLVNRKPLTPGSGSRFVEPEDIQFEYTSLSLRNPENVRFQYRLEGRDKDWIDAGTQRRAVYGSLAPGAYRFHVIGTGSEGVWNDTGASYDFLILAPFYKTGAFFVAVAMALAAMSWLLYRYRLQQVAERIRLRMQAQNDERLRIAQAMHDSFLQGIQGSSLMVYAAIEKIEAGSREARSLLERALELVSDSTEQARDMLTSLRAGASEEPLLDRLRTLAASESALYRQPPPIAVECSGTARGLTPAVSQDVFLIVAEGLRNALRHARAKQIRISIDFGRDATRLTIADDGVGMEGEIRRSGRAGHFGLTGMRERAARHSGELSIECANSERPESGGTVLRVSIPAFTLSGDAIGADRR